MLPTSKFTLLASTIWALQIFGIVPCVSKMRGNFSGNSKRDEKQPLKSCVNIKLKSSRLMLLWCTVLRVPYVIGIVIVLQEYRKAQKGQFDLTQIMLPMIFFVFVYNALFSPLKWRTNIRLLKQLLKVESRNPTLAEMIFFTKARLIFITGS